MERHFLLVSDVDGTLLGDDPATVAFAAWHERRREVRLALNSGRFTASLQRSIERTALPAPDALVGGVGTEIRLGPDWDLLDGWPAADGWNAAVVREALENHPRTRLQEEEFLSEHKISAHAVDLTLGELVEIEEALAAAGVAARVVYSSARDLDVLPCGVDKGTAALRLASHWGIPPERVIVAGDSGNDAAMFRIGARGILVGNAQADLRKAAAGDVYPAAASYAAGVIEGAEYWLARLSSSGYLPVASRSSVTPH